MFYFLVIAFFGALMLALSSLGGDSDADMDADGGVLDAGDGPGLLSLKTISTFMIGLGLTGAVASASMGIGFQLVSLALGLAGGIVASGFTYQVLKLVYKQQATSVTSLQDLIGRDAQVSIAIPAEGVGQIACAVHENRVYEEARSKDKGPISVGERVYITNIESGVAIVERWEVLESGME